MTEGIELPNQERSERLEKKEFTKTWEYWKRTTSNKWKRKKIFKKSISEERDSYSKLNYTAEISSKE